MKVHLLRFSKGLYLRRSTIELNFRLPFAGFKSWSKNLVRIEFLVFLKYLAIFVRQTYSLVIQTLSFPRPAYRLPLMHQDTRLPLAAPCFVTKARCWPSEPQGSSPFEALQYE